MFDSPAIEVAVGLTFVFALLSLISTALSEWVDGLLRTRAKTLKEGIANLLRDPTLAEEVYNHPLIRGLAKKDSLPSYISARTFRQVLLHVYEQSGAQAGQDDKASKPAPEPDAVDRALAALAAEHGGDLVKSAKNLEDWFDDAMDRVSGWYKRKSQRAVVIIALVVTALLNADTLMMADILWQNPTTRAAVTQMAERAASQAGESNPTNDADRDASDDGNDEGSGPNLDDLVDKLEQQGLFGWSSNESDPRALPTDLPGCLLKLLGCLVTAVAVSLGAPFWFDLLNRFVKLRAAGRRPKVRAEASEPA